MAAINSAKALQQTQKRPRVPYVSPAIPKHFVQTRRKQQAVRTEDEEAPAVAPAVTEEALPPSPPSPRPRSDDNAAEANGAQKPDPIEASAELDESGASSEVVATPATEDETAVSSTQAEGSVHETEQQIGPASAPSETVSSTSRSTYQMPPPFVPANPNPPPTVSSDSVKLPPQPFVNGHASIHHGHPSVGSSIVFAAGPESSSSSPAPPPSANVPPYPHQQYPQPRFGNGRPPHLMNGASPVSNGFPPMGPPPPGYYAYQDSNMSAAADNYARRQLFGYAPDGYSPSSTPMAMDGHRYNNYDPPTPHSFQGSQTSAPSEQENGGAFHTPYPVIAASAGSNGPGEGPQLSNQQRPKVHVPNQNSLPQQPPSQVPLPIDTLDGLVNFVYHQFNNVEFADYVVELRPTDDRFTVQQVYGHGLMFARSPALKMLMSSLKHEGKYENHSIRPLLLQTNDRFIRPDAFWMAMHRLYGGALLDMETVGHVNVLNAPPHAPLPVSIPGSTADRLDMALAYAASGHILQMPPVIIRGVEIACGLIDWATVEKALDFAIDGGLDAQWTQESAHSQPETPSTYGPSVNSLIYRALQFAIYNFPGNFELDDTVEDAVNNSRLPVIVQDRPSTSDRRLPQFGDFSDQEDGRSTSSTSANSILSKILLNLPFHLLKYVLEFRRLGNVEPWGNVVIRRKAMDTVVAEREKRRLRIYNNSRVANATRQQNHSSWQPVGYQEYVDMRATGDGGHSTPTLARKWVDYVLPAQHN